MAVREYIGARYVPIFGRVDETSIEWDNTKPYEPLTVVLYQGASYTSRQYVPVGVPITNEEFWALTGNYNAQVEAYRQEVRTFDDRITENATAIEQNSDAILENANDITAEAAARVAADDAETQARTQAIAAETQAREQAITALTNGLNAEHTARESADTTLTNSIAAETQAREAAVNELNGKFPVANANIADSAVTRSKLAADVLNLHKTATDEWNKAYINVNTGDDSTAVVNDESKPFRTLQAAVDELAILGNNYDFIFQTAGTFTLRERFFVGSVVHFRAPAGVSGNIVIAPENPASTAGMFFYDCHVNFIGYETCPIIFNMPNRMVEQEGSTFWVHWTTFNCTYMNLIQGGAFFFNSTINGYVTAFMCAIRINGLTINNKVAAHALYMSGGTLRLWSNDAAPTAILIKRNPNGGSSMGIRLETVHASLTAAMGGESNIGYDRYMATSGTVIHAADGYLDTMNSYGAANLCQFTALSLRIAEGGKFPQA